MWDKPFDASQFVATECDSAADKAAFGNTYLHFIESDWKQRLFTKSFYQRLSNCFGYMAYYNQGQFYETWFTCDKDRLDRSRVAPIATAVVRPAPEPPIAPVTPIQGSLAGSSSTALETGG